MMRWLLWIILFLCLGLAACDKDEPEAFGSSALTFSEPEVCFDTLFTQVGASTKRLMVYNPHSRGIKASVYLAQGGSSGYRVTVDGIPLAGNTPLEFSIAAKDSMYVFVEVTVSPRQNDAPILVTDSLVFQTPGMIQDVNLLAWGQDVHVLRDTILSSAEWTSAKPYLLYGRVEVAPGETLSLSEGVRVYLHKAADLVVNGTLLTHGTFEQPVVFQGDRLEKRYQNYPGQWGSILLSPESAGNHLVYTEIRNGTMGLCVGSETSAERPDIALEQCKIVNMSYAGIYAYRASLRAVNTLVANAGSYTVGVWAGNATFIHCTLANNYSPYMGRSGNPVLTIGNVFGTDALSSSAVPLRLKDAPFSPLQVLLANSLIYGTMSTEVEMAPPCSMLDGGSGNCADVRFESCIVRVFPATAFSNNSSFVDCINNPAGFSFAKPSALDFTPDSLSAARNAASRYWAEQVPLDLSGNNRLQDGHPDIGAYEIP